MPGPAYADFSTHDGLSIAYRVSGQGRPVVLIHGYTVTSTMNYATHYEWDDAENLTATAGPTVESALLDAGFQVVLYDLRGHGHSARPHDQESYSMDAHVGDVQALVDHLALHRPAVVGYSFGSMIAGRLLGLPWVSAAVLSGTGPDAVEGFENPYVDWGDLARCFAEGCWEEFPDLAWLRMTAMLDEDPDLLALAAVARGARQIPRANLQAATVPVLVLNGGADGSPEDAHGLAGLVPGARVAIVGDSDHGVAPSDPLFQDELVSFLQNGR
jgi:pimeloyl-ACP methyl ester carboxylesterase